MNIDPHPFWCVRCEVHMRMPGGRFCPVCLDDNSHEPDAA